jgi:hypothetical protein
MVIQITSFYIGLIKEHLEYSSYYSVSGCGQEYQPSTEYLLCEVIVISNYKAGFTHLIWKIIVYIYNYEIGRYKSFIENLHRQYGRIIVEILMAVLCVSYYPLISDVSHLKLLRSQTLVIDYI